MIQKLLMLFLLLVCCLCQAQNKYVLTADSKKKVGVEYGEHIYARLISPLYFPVRYVK